LTEILEALESRENLIGITSHCAPKGPEVIGSPKALEVSRILNLKPDWIFADVRENRPEEIRELKKKHPVIEFDVRSIQSAKDAIIAVGRTIGKPEKARELAAAIEEEWAAIRQRVAERNHRVRTLLLLWKQPYVTVNFDTYASRLMEACGAENVFHAEPLPEFPVELEDMIEQNPELVLLAGDPYVFKKADIARFRKYRIFSKVRIECVNGRLFSCFGPTTIEALKKMRDLIL